MPNICFCGNDNLTDYSEMYWKCTVCGTLVSKLDFNETICQVHDEENDLYGKKYWEKVMLQEAGVSEMDELLGLYFEGRVPYWLKYITQYIPFESEVLEVGCGLGQLAYLMKCAGYKQEALELSPEICKFVERKFDVNIRAEDYAALKQKYAAVLAFDLFEHLLNPEKFIEWSYEHLECNGTLCMQTPCYDSDLSYAEMKTKKPRFELLMVPEQHIYLYSRKSMEYLLRKKGFKDIAFEPAYFGDDYDMFVFASKTNLNKKTESVAEQELKKQKLGWLIWTVIHLAEEKEKIHKINVQIEQDRKKRLENNQKLELLIQEKEKELIGKEEVIQNQLKLIKSLEK